MSGHDHCCTVATLFDAKLAIRDLNSYRQRGPSASTRRLLTAMHDADRPAETVLDVGGGVGTIAHELLEQGATHATVVDASPSYLTAARHEAERRGTTDRLRLRLGDFVEIANDVDAADVVTLDKVVCCYPDMETLLAVSAAHARSLYGIVYPSDRWWVRLAIRVENAVRRLRGSDFRSFIHPNAAIDAMLRSAGLVLCSRTRGAWWVVAVYARRATSDDHSGETMPAAGPLGLREQVT